MSEAVRTVVVGGPDEIRQDAIASLRAAGLEAVDDPAAAADVAVAIGVEPIADLRRRDLAVVALVADAGAAEVAFAAGAADVVDRALAPTLPTRVARVVRHAAADRAVAEAAELGATLRQILALLATYGDEPEVVREVLALATVGLGYDRASLIASIESSALAYVIAATDDPNLTEFCLEVASYPEISDALRHAGPRFVADVRTDPLTQPVLANLEAAGVRSLAVFPVILRKRGLGVVLFRKRELAAPLSQAQIDFAGLLAAQLGLHLRDSHVIQRLSDETRKISRASYEAERRLRTIESLKEHFEASADGVFVVDEDGRLLFVNGAAESITGFARERLIGSVLVDLVTSDQRAPLDNVVAGVLGGTNLDAFDLDLLTTSGNPIIVSVATSTVLARSGAAILSFRDVTSERVLESELQKTKDFLQKLIDSAVDAIIAADLAGNVILFNPGAEQLTGWSHDEVIGQMAVTDLYAEGQARRVMAMLRSPLYGGIGRLEQTRHQVRTKSGELIPVNMTASIIYDQGQEVATVGIFSDLRERLRIEQRLLEAQERLEEQEREAMVAQLAGAAAHELNQPLTSIIGYVELIGRKSEPDAPHARALGVILAEAQRMADIVKKIGRITRYEIKEYVGSASIMDLDRSAALAATVEPLDPESPFETAILDYVEDEPTSRINLTELAQTSRPLAPERRPPPSPPQVDRPRRASEPPPPEPEPGRVASVSDTSVGHVAGRGRKP